MPQWLMKSRVDSVLSKANQGRSIQTSITGHVFTTIGSASSTEKKQIPSKATALQQNKPDETAGICVKCETVITWYLKSYFYSDYSI